MFFFKQKTAYEMRISDWSSDVCSSDLLAVGFGNGEMYLGSDALALAPLTDRIAYMEEGDCVILSRTGARFLDADGKPAERVVRATAISGAMIGKGNYRHYMLKEIYEQPAVMGDTINTVIGPTNRLAHLPDLGIDLGRSEERRVGKEGVSKGK